MKNILGKPDLPSLLFSLSKRSKNEVKINQVLLNTFLICISPHRTWKRSPGSLPPLPCSLRQLWNSHLVLERSAECVLCVLLLTIHYKGFKNTLSFGTTRSHSFCATVREQKVIEGHSSSPGSVWSNWWEQGGLLPKLPGAAFWRQEVPARAAVAARGIIYCLLRPLYILTQRAKCGYCQKNSNKTPKPSESCRKGLSVPCLRPRPFCPLTLSSLTSWKWSVVQ